MLQAQQPTSFTKSPADGTYQAAAGGKQPKKIFGLDVRSLMTVGGLTLFFVVAMLGAVIALRQSTVKGPVAPTAPQSKPDAAQKLDNCSLVFTVQQVGSPTSTPSASPTTSPTASPTTSPTASPTTSPTASPTTSPTASPTESPTTSPTTSPTATPTSVSYSCNSSCTTNAECQSGNGNHVCYNGACRLSTNPTSAQCMAAGCNDQCVTNSDCGNTSHVCVSNRCRLDSYPDSATCTVPAAPIAQQPQTQQQVTQQVAQQPVLPSELPRTGPEGVRNVGNWLKAGLVILVGGALLLLL